MLLTENESKSVCLALSMRDRNNRVPHHLFRSKLRWSSHAFRLSLCDSMLLRDRSSICKRYGTSETLLKGIVTLTFPASMSRWRSSSLEPLRPVLQGLTPLSNTSSISSSVFPLVSGAARNTWIPASPLRAAKIMYIFQLISHINGGTAKARAQFHAQFDAVASETALARIAEGYISAGYVQLEGPHCEMTELASPILDVSGVETYDWDIFFRVKYSKTISQLINQPRLGNFTQSYLLTYPAQN